MNVREDGLCLNVTDDGYADTSPRFIAVVGPIFVDLTHRFRAQSKWVRSRS